MNTFHQIYKDLFYRGERCAPRGKPIVELEDYSFVLGPRERFTSFAPRKLNLDYTKEEFLWYLRADPKDDIVTESAQMWRDLRQPDGTYLSNYGVYWFRGDSGGFYWVLNSLLSDPSSRQAVIPMLRREHLYVGNPDVVCTYSIGFRIRGDCLYMSVNMRSQDAIWGMSNDIPCFSFLHEMMYVMLRDTKYPNLRLGNYHHKVDSLHVYERHFEMLEDLADDDVEIYEIDCPWIEDAQEVSDLIEDAGRYSSKFNFTSWLRDNRYRREREAGR